MARRYRKCFLWECCPFLRSLAIRSLDCLVGDVVVVDVVVEVVLLLLDCLILEYVNLGVEEEEDEEDGSLDEDNEFPDGNKNRSSNLSISPLFNVVVVLELLLLLLPPPPPRLFKKDPNRLGGEGSNIFLMRAFSGSSSSSSM